jgi:hypothetical protein
MPDIILIYKGAVHCLHQQPADRCAAIAVEKMATEEREVHSMLWFHRTISVTATQGWFRREFGLHQPTRPSMYACDKQCAQSGCLCKGKSCGRVPACEKCVGSKRPVFVDSLRNLKRLDSSELTIPQPTV